MNVETVLVSDASASGGGDRMAALATGPDTPRILTQLGVQLPA